ncbi:MAG TPA: MFS transporter [Candidatus Limnocylindrales bacterium]
MNQPLPVAGPSRRRWLGLTMLSLGVAMIIVDATIVNVAVPSIARDLGLSGTTTEWVNTIYALVFAAFLVTMGRLGDRIGRRKMYITGLGLFLVASVLAGFAPSGETLIGARLLQGLGGAAILPATQSILNEGFRGRERAIAFGIWGSVIGGMAALGPLIGGWLTTYLSWRWAFYVNVPIGILAIIGTIMWIDESCDENAQGGFDPFGFVLVTLGLSSVVFGLIEGYTYGWTSPSKPFELFGLRWPLDSISIIPFAFVAGLVMLVAFAIVEIRRQRAGKFFLFDFGLWRYPAFRYGNLAGTIVSLGEFGLLFALPLFLQAVLGMSAFEVGLTILALAVGAFFAAPTAAALANRFGPRRVVTLGMSLEAIGIFVTTLLLSRTLNVLWLVPPLFVYGVGVGFSTAQLTSIVLSEVPTEVSGLASGTNSMLRQIGAALGIAILGSALFVSLGVGTGDRLAKIPGMSPAAQVAIRQAIEGSAGQALIGFRTGQVDPAVATQIGGGLDPATIGQLGKVVAPPIEDAFVDAARTAGFTATAFVLLGLLFSLLLPKSKQQGMAVDAPAEVAPQIETP